MRVFKGKDWERTALGANAAALVGATDVQIEALKLKGTIVELERAP